jgi:hypothetical protein
MYVGDGTWDSERNTFLLPNLQGLNLATTQYNGNDKCSTVRYHDADFLGMGNRFRNMAGYHSLIIGHGTVAAITFLLILPVAIFMARFYHRNPRMALRLHIWLQIMVVLLSTAVFVLGFQAVGSKRSLTNPHHGIGVALYAMVLAQAFAGCIIHRTEKGKERFKVPLRLMVCDFPSKTKRTTHTDIASSMDGESYCDSWHHSGCTWNHFVWLTQVDFHRIRRLDFPTAHSLLRYDLQKSA